MDNTLPYWDYGYIMDNLKEYASPKSKLTHMIKSGQIIRLRRGLYLSGGQAIRRNVLANRIYGPSYVSFESALAWHSMIPEKVNSLTSACLAKNRNKLFEAAGITFIYRDVPKAVYPYGIIRVKDGNAYFLMACKEKALCDTLARIPKISSQEELLLLLYEDLRLDQNDIKELSVEDVCFIAEKYKKKTVSLFCKYLQEVNR